jgi:hypothetical protein
MPLTAVAAATTLLANAMKALDSLREQAKGSKDVALKQNISNLYDNLLDVKAAVIRVEEENSELRRTIAEQAEKPPKPEPRQVGNAIYYFIGDKGPYCQPCYDVNRRMALLSPQAEYAGGRGRKCEACKTVFFETTRSPTGIQVGAHGGSDGWMR